jgi:nucleoside-diphosphate-sugar epimerase
MKHALVTGGLGFIGSSFVRLLVRYGIKVTIIDNYSYAIDCSKLMEFGWKHFYSLKSGMGDIAYWYKHNIDWLEQNKEKNKQWLSEQYGK